MRTVFVLGAGASKDAGAPLMMDFIDRAMDLRRWRRPGAAEMPYYDTVAAALNHLQRVHSKAQLDLRNLETVFAAFEMGEQIGFWEGTQVSKPADALRRVISSTLELSMPMRLTRTQDMSLSLEAPGTYRGFGALVGGMLTHGHEVDVVTFNYDVGLELGLAASSVGVDYGLDADRDGPKGSPLVVPVHKLHGSLHWSLCTKDKSHVLRVPIGEIMHRPDIRTDIGSHDQRVVVARVRSLLSKLEHCGAHGDDTPLIVPPTLHKGHEQAVLERVWRKAAKALSTAENIVVIGYSWPASDQFFHHLFALGVVGSTLLRRFWIINPDRAVRRRFEESLLINQSLHRVGPIEDWGFGGMAIAVGKLGSVDWG